MISQEEMIRVIRKKYGLNDAKVLKAMLTVPRDEFVPQELTYLAFEDQALSIGFGQTISQPFTVAFMTHLLKLKGDEEVLEIGTGSGYQAAILSKLAKKVYSIEKIGELAHRAKVTLEKLGFKNVSVKAGSGEKGWSKKSLFDAILVTAGIGGDVPQALFDQLKEGGVLVAPVGEDSQKMIRIRKTPKGLKKEEFGTFSFVPFVKSN